MTTVKKIVAASLALLMAGAAGAASATTTTFSNGYEGWTGNGLIDPSVGTPAPALHSYFIDYRTYWFNVSNPAFIGDYTSAPSWTISLDVLTNSIVYLGEEVPREMGVWLTDIGDPDNFYDDVNLYYDLGTISAAVGGWQHLGTTIADTSALDLPAGWAVTDGEGNLELPAGRTFSNVLASIDMISFSTHEPDTYYGPTKFDVVGDNFTVTPGVAPVPEPGSWAMMIAGLGALGAAMRWRRPRLALQD